MKSSKPYPVKARVIDFVVEITLNDGSIIERDFTFVDGPAFKKWKRKNGIDPRVRINDGEMAWPGEIDFCLDAVIWGSHASKRKRPLKRAAVMPGGLVPAPWVRDIC